MSREIRAGFASLLVTIPFAIILLQIDSPVGKALLVTGISIVAFAGFVMASHKD